MYFLIFVQNQYGTLVVNKREYLVSLFTISLLYVVDAWNRIENNKHNNKTSLILRLEAKFNNLSLSQCDIALNSKTSLLALIILVLPSPIIV